MNTNIHSKLKLAELTSTIGAGVLGFGLGIYFFKIITINEYIILLIGIVLHSLGMYFKHKLEKGLNNLNSDNITTSPIWVTVVYWLCWLLLGVFLIYLWIKMQG